MFGVRKGQMIITRGDTAVLNVEPKGNVMPTEADRMIFTVAEMPEGRIVLSKIVTPGENGVCAVAFSSADTENLPKGRRHREYTYAIRYALGAEESGGKIVSYREMITPEPPGRFIVLEANGFPESVPCVKDDRMEVELASFRGPQGEQGAIGPVGPQGPKGDKGDKGERGEAGADGKDAVIDATLTQAGQAADAKKVGDEFETVREGLDNKAEKARQNILIGTETGTTVSAADAFAAPLCGLTIYGRSTQDGTPTPDAPVPIVSAGDGGTISVTIGDGADERQTITLQTPNGLPGIPVKSGGNYTDENGQQWICDEIDLTRGVRVQRVGSYTLKNITIHGFDNLANNYRIINATEIEKKASGTVYSLLCTDYENNQVDQWAWPEKNNRISWSGDPYRQLRVYDERDQAEIIESLNSGNVRVDYVLGDPVETPLTDAEIAAYKALAAYAPTITAEVADGAGIRLSYQKDVNLVIRNLEDVIASMSTKD